MTIDMIDIRNGKRAEAARIQGKARQWSGITRAAIFVAEGVITLSIAFIAWGCVWH